MEGAVRMSDLCQTGLATGPGWWEGTPPVTTRLFYSSTNSMLLSASVFPPWQLCELPVFHKRADLTWSRTMSSVAGPYPVSTPSSAFM